jgi:uncharacterized protein with PIN domain
MKRLTPQQIEGLIRLIGQTREHEFNCEECQRNISEFAERKIAGLPLPGALAGVEQHLRVCSECHEEFLALEKVLRAG